MFLVRFAKDFDPSAFYAIKMKFFSASILKRHQHVCTKVSADMVT